jgi:hypothetical protein
MEQRRMKVSKHLAPNSSGDTVDRQRIAAQCCLFGAGTPHSAATA